MGGLEVRAEVRCGGWGQWSGPPAGQDLRPAPTVRGASPSLYMVGVVTGDGGPWERSGVGPRHALLSSSMCDDSTIFYYLGILTISPYISLISPLYHPAMAIQSTRLKKIMLAKAIRGSSCRVLLFPFYLTFVNACTTV